MIVVDVCPTGMCESHNCKVHRLIDAVLVLVRLVLGNDLGLVLGLVLAAISLRALTS